MAPELDQEWRDLVDTEVRAEVRPILRRMWIWGACMIVAIAVGTMVAVYLYTQGQNHDQARAVALVHDNCVRSQQGRRALALIVHTAIPPLDRSRTAQEQAQVDQFYQKVAPALKVPQCT